MRVEHSVVVITGASSGVGRATALALADARAHVVLAARGVEALSRVAEECALRGAQALVVPTDVSEATAVEELARRAVERFGRLDVWVNNAAVMLVGRLEETPLEDLRRVLDVNLMGYVHGARAALPHLRAQRRGVLVNVASMLGTVAQPYAVGYVMAKFAIRGLSAGLRQELRLTGDRGVHVAAVLPGTIDTPLYAHAANYSGRRLHATPPVHTPERVAGAILNVVRWPRREVIVGAGERIVGLQSRLMPALVERLVARKVERTLSRAERAPFTSGILYEPGPGAGATRAGGPGVGVGLADAGCG